MKSLLIILIAIAIAAGGFIYYKGQNPTEPQPNETVVVDEAPQPLSQPEPEVIAPDPMPAPVIAGVDFAQRAAGPFTTLTDKQGREIQAKVLSVTDDQIKLRRKDGLETTIPLSMLSEDDIAFCEYLRQQLPQIAEIPLPAKTMPQVTPDSKALEAQGGIDWDAIFGN